MFKKVLIANRGEIAVRILRTCRDLGIESVSVYEPEDQSSLHVRLADQCYRLNSEAGYMDGEEILEIARESGAEAIHPGYGFLAERADFAALCREQGLVFIGPPAEVLSEGQARLEQEREAPAEPASPRYTVRVQLLADARGNMIHLGERQISFLHGNQRVVEESPAPFLDEATRLALWERALEIARRYRFQGLGSVEFQVDGDGQLYYTNFKSYLQAGHPITELRSGVDLVAEGLRLAAGERLSLSQEQAPLQGWAMLCRINAVDPWNDFLPSPGRIQHLRFPGGPGIRVDTHIYSGYEAPSLYSPILAKLAVHAREREECLRRMRRALREVSLSGIPTNLPLLQLIFEDPDFSQGLYTDGRVIEQLIQNRPEPEGGKTEAGLRDLAIAAAILYLQRKERFRPVLPERLLSGWHRSSRRIGY